MLCRVLEICWSFVSCKFQSDHATESKCIILEKLFEGRSIPHIVRGQRSISIAAIRVLALDRVIAQMNRLVEVRQTEFLGAESQVTFPANKRMLYYYSLFRWIVLLVGFACRTYRSMNTIIGSSFTQTGLCKLGSVLQKVNSWLVISYNLFKSNELPSYNFKCILASCFFLLCELFQMYIDDNCNAFSTQ